MRGKLLGRVALGQIEHFVLQIVGNAVRHAVFTAAESKMRVDGAKIHAQKGVTPRKARLRKHTHAQAVRQLLLVELFSELWIGKELHVCAPFRK